MPIKPNVVLPLVAALGLLVQPVGAQVGHDPSRSPYRDLRYGQFVSLSVGKAFGAGGTIGVGPHDGEVAWLRHEFLGDRTVSVGLAGGFARLDRNIAFPDSVNNPVRGPFQHNVYFAEGTIQFNLTGGKTWHSIAPYANVGLGFAFGEKLPADSSGYKLKTKFYLAPSAGVRLFLSRRMYARVEARAVFWSLTYPGTYRGTDPDGFGPAKPILAGQALKEWAPVPMIHAGLGYAFKNPFF